MRVRGKKKFVRSLVQTLIVVALATTLVPSSSAKKQKPPLPPEIMQAKAVYVFCDACPRAMAAAKTIALDELSDWGQFKVVRDPKQADLIFLFSGNQYLGDYLTRDGPDTRPVHIEITYLDIVDPRTGESLWSDTRRWGSWMVPRATRSLIEEFRLQFEAQLQPQKPSFGSN
jgi:hypothetical protein